MYVTNTNKKTEFMVVSLVVGTWSQIAQDTTEFAQDEAIISAVNNFSSFIDLIVGTGPSRRLLGPIKKILPGGGSNPKPTPSPKPSPAPPIVPKPKPKPGPRFIGLDDTLGTNPRNRGGSSVATGGTGNLGNSASMADF